MNDVNDNPVKKNGDPNTQVELALALLANCEYFHDQDHNAFITLSDGGCFKTLAVRGREFQIWLAGQFYNAHKKPIGSHHTETILSLIESRCLYNGEQKQVHFRNALVGESIFIDLHDSKCRVVEITKSGWHVKDRVDCKFKRNNSAMALPLPTKCEATSGILKLRRFLNCGNDSDFHLYVLFLIFSLKAKGPFLGLVLNGQQGSAKSTSVRVLRSLIDPNKAPLRRCGRNSDDVFVSAKANYVLVLDNVSYIDPTMSDDLCCVLSGGGLAKRGHYTNDEEIVLDVVRPVIINGIEECVTRGDLASRCIILNLPAIHESQRQTEEQFVAEFERDRPEILGALYAALSCGLRESPNTKISNMPRMADALKWATACEGAFGWPNGTMTAAFRQNQIAANSVILSGWQIYPLIVELSIKHFVGQAIELLGMIQAKYGSANRENGLPRTPKGVGDQLCRRRSPEGPFPPVSRAHGGHSCRFQWGHLSV